MIPSKFPRPFRHWGRALSVPLLLLLAVAATGCVNTGVNPVTGDSRVFGYSWQEERKMGRRADDQIRRKYGVYEDEALQKYVDEVARTVLAESDLRRPSTRKKFRKTEFHFRVLDSPSVNAFALPGGYVYVTRGLLAHLNNETQLAVVLGHEIAHVAARHASQQAARKKLTRGLLLSGAIVGQATLGGNVGRKIMGIGGTAAKLISLRYSRAHERQADRLGVEYAAKAGYDAAEAAGFFTALKRLQKQSGHTLPTWKSTHPDPGAREDRVVKLAKKWKKKAKGPQTVQDQAEYYDAIERLVVGDDPRHGFTENGVFYHPNLAFRFPVPVGWRVRNDTRQVVLIQPDREAYVVFELAETDSLRAAAAEFVRKSGVTVVGRRKKTVNGLEAWRLLAKARTRRGVPLRIMAYYVAYDGQVYRFKGMTRAGRYIGYRRVFERTMTGFAVLEDRDILNIQPPRLAIRPADRPAPFRTFVDESTLPEGFSPTDLAIINQIELGDPVEQGRPLKLLR